MVRAPEGIAAIRYSLPKRIAYSFFNLNGKRPMPKRKTLRLAAEIKPTIVLVIK